MARITEKVFKEAPILLKNGKVTGIDNGKIRIYKKDGKPLHKRGDRIMKTTGSYHYYPQRVNYAREEVQFDSVKREEIWKVLENKKILQNLIKAVKEYLQKGKQQDKNTVYYALVKSFINKKKVSRKIEIKFYKTVINKINRFVYKIYAFEN